MRCIASHTARRWRVPPSFNGSSNSKRGSSRYDWICTQARNAIVLRGGAKARTVGARKRMPLTCLSVAVMPSVANGVRTHAWNAPALPSGMGGFPRERADLREEVRGDAHAFSLPALAIGAASLAGKPHVIVGEHRLDERLDPPAVHRPSREPPGIHPEDGRPEPSLPSVCPATAVRLESV